MAFSYPLFIFSVMVFIHVHLKVFTSVFHPAPSVGTASRSSGKCTFLIVAFMRLITNTSDLLRLVFGLCLSCTQILFPSRCWLAASVAFSFPCCLQRTLPLLTMTPKNGPLTLNALLTAWRQFYLSQRVGSNTLQVEYVPEDPLG